MGKATSGIVRLHICSQAIAFVILSRSYQKKPSISREGGTSHTAPNIPHVICVLSKKDMGTRGEMEKTGSVLCDPRCLPAQVDGRAGYFSYKGQSRARERV